MIMIDMTQDIFAKFPLIFHHEDNVITLDNADDITAKSYCRLAQGAINRVRVSKSRL